MLRRLGLGVTRHIGSNLVAYLALFVALSGSAVAAAPLLSGAKIQDGTINSADLRDRGATAYPGPSIQGADVEADSITGQEVDESSLSRVDAALGHVLADGTVSAASGGLAATALTPTVFLLTFTNFDRVTNYAVFGQPVSSVADAQGSTFEVVSPNDPDLAVLLDGQEGIAVRVRRLDGTPVPEGFFVRIVAVAG